MKKTIGQQMVLLIGSVCVGQMGMTFGKKTVHFCTV